MTEQAETIIRTFEGLRLKAYQDQGGVWTIGYGCTGPSIDENTVWTIQQAESCLQERIARAAALIAQYIKVPLNDNQLSALESLIYNEGVKPLTGTLGQLLNNGNYTSAALQFSRWVYIGNQISIGLTKRRAIEQKLFQTPTGE